jgi:hypothetical protein
MEYLADDAIKVYMPVTGKTVPTGSYTALKRYISARADEIHLPIVDHNLVRENLRWVPMTPFKGCKELKPGRPYITCMVHVQSALGDDLDALLCKATEEANQFNAVARYAEIGAMRAFSSMDGVSKVLHLYSDDMVALQTCLGLADTPHAPATAAVVG